MKKTILALMLTFISISLYASTVTPLGYCGDRSYFSLSDMAINRIYEVRYGEQIVTWTTLTPDTVIYFNFIMPKDGTIDIRFKGTNPDAVWQGWWYGWKAGNFEYANCSSLPVRIFDFKVKKNESSIDISFSTAEEQGILKYEVLASKNGIDFNKVDEIVATGKSSYSTSLSMLSLAFLPLLLFVRKKKHLLFILSMVLILFACKKENVFIDKSEYTYLKIVAVGDNGQVDESRTILVK